MLPELEPLHTQLDIQRGQSQKCEHSVVGKGAVAIVFALAFLGARASLQDGPGLSEQCRGQLSHVCGVRANDLPPKDKRSEDDSSERDADETQTRALPESAKQGMTALHCKQSLSALLDMDSCERALEPQVLDGVSNASMRKPFMKEPTQL